MWVDEIFEIKLRRQNPDKISGDWENQRRKWTSSLEIDYIFWAIINALRAIDIEYDWAVWSEDCSVWDRAQTKLNSMHN